MMTNEKRLIDAKAALDALYDADAITMKGVKIINQFPTIDAMEVVRCKDCRNSMLWRKPMDTVIGECFIRKMNSDDEQFCMVGADDFCSYGERRNDNG